MKSTCLGLNSTHWTYSSPYNRHEGPEGEQRYCSTLSSTSTLVGVGGQRHAPHALPAVQTRYPLYRRMGRPQGWSGLVRKFSSPLGFDPWTVQPVASPYRLRYPCSATQWSPKYMPVKAISKDFIEKWSLLVFSTTYNTQIQKVAGCRIF